MTIQPLSNRPREISVTEPLEPAYERMKRMLFKPFNLNKWIVIGFCAWLAGLGESGGGSGFNGGDHFGGNRGQAAGQLRHVYHQARDFVLVNLAWIIPVASLLLVVGLALWLLVLWVNSRGKFMFLHCVVLDVAQVEAPWTKFAAAANRLFWFRLVLGAVGLVLMLPLLAFLGADILRMVLRGGADVAGVIAAIGLGLVFLGVSLVFGLIHKFMVDFVVPIMFLRGDSCLAAWRELGGLLAGHFWHFVVYLLFQIVLAMAIGVIVLLGILVTCCIAGCLLMLPFVGTVLLLPVLVFKRAYPLYYLAQFGPQYDLFPKPTTLPASPAQTPPAAWGTP